jgi:ubiquinone biosynthesis accessory factor UbiJ
MPAVPAWLAAIEAVLNRGIGQSQRAGDAAARLNGTSFELEIRGLARVRGAVSAGRLALLSAAQGAPAADAVVSGSAFALVELFAGRLGKAAPKSDDRVEIRGDAEIAARYRELLALARPDWEEELSRLIGDLPARRVALAAQSVLSWIRKSARTGAQNLSEYLQEESRDLVSAPELEEFLAGVDALRETADRVEARLERIERELRGLG